MFHGMDKLKNWINFDFEVKFDFKVKVNNP